METIQNKLNQEANLLCSIGKYEKPTIEVVETEAEGVLCGSGDNFKSGGGYDGWGKNGSLIQSLNKEIEGTETFECN